MIPEKIRLWIEERWPEEKDHPMGEYSVGNIIREKQQESATETAEHLLKDVQDLVEGLNLLYLGDWSSISGAETYSDYAEELMDNWNQKYGEQSDGG